MVNFATINEVSVLPKEVSFEKRGFQADANTMTLDVVDERKRQRKETSTFFSSRTANDIQTEFLESLCTPDYQQDRIQIKDASSTTCEWIWRRKAYISFRSYPGSRILHVYGNAGSGKSVLAKYIWKGLSKEFESLPERDTPVLLYYCCNERTRPDESASSILRALIHQFLWQRPSSFHNIVQSNELLQSHSFSAGSTGWTFDSLWFIINDIVANARDQLYCIIDGLDECENESTGTLLSLLPDLLEKRTNNAFVKFLVTSRAKGHIVDVLEEHATSITITSDITRNDVELYVGERLVGLKRRLRLSSEEERDLRRLLADRANGMFLWVELAIKDLERTYGIRAKTVVNRVRSLPSGLNALYERMLSKIDAMCDDQDTLQLVRKMLTWISLAARPLTLNELRIALAMEIDFEYLDLLEPLQNITYDLLGLCGSFVEIVRGTDDGIPVGTEGQIEANETRDLSATVRLIHQSAKEYLVDSAAIPDSLSRFCIDGWTGNAEMARICLAYLLSHDFEGGPVPEASAGGSEPGDAAALLEQKLARFGLLQYASRYWPTHVRAGNSEDVNMRACRLLENNSNHFRSWQQISIFVSKSKPTHHFAGIHVASALGLDAVLRLLLDQGSDIEARDSNSGTALHYATAMGNVEMAKLLVSQGANIEARDHENSTALHFAASTGNVVMTKLLLDHGAKIAYEDNETYPALHVAAWAGHVEVVKLLLDRGAEIDAVYRDGRTAFYLAAERGNLAVVRLLRERGAQAGAKYWEVFILATLAGSLREFNFLHGRQN